MTQTPATPPDSTPASPGARFFGYLLMAIGGLMAGLCGLCSLVLIAAGAADAAKGYGDEFGAMLFVIALFGGIPTLIGAGVFYAGFVLRRPRR